MGIQSLPLSKSKRKFRLRRITMHRALSAALWAVLLFLSLTGSRLALAQGGLHRVNHIIIVMQENHSFDNYFGALAYARSEEHTSELQSHSDLVCRLLLEKKK